jgi:hypothetical protein
VPTEGALHTAARDDDVSHMLINGKHREQFEKDEDNVSEILKKMR